ncbi:hypothetical protein H0I29_11210 [Polaribacter sp. R2A056_3_33]|uniref:hypothetical protein n=1 Tax=Polaribacter sp. R2A056_3_33 TaxID=2745563 RepID=UPI001C4FA451|nr:hypothetical protein [Polaribacter sp. R2A056_3_33]QXP69200.1 hypothetical protein H0I29_11210 [Polaribacter sp. R2A056_3_33]
MDNFAQIKPLFKYKTVAYYSVCLGDNEKTLYQEFVEKHTFENKNKLYHIQKWLKIIGEKYGAQNRFFRNEAKNADTSALPPIGTDRKPYYVEYGKKKANNLRLYCLRANSNVVFLFSGDIKTKQKAQDCPNVKSHFILANNLTKAIDNAFREKEIIWNENCTLISCSEEFILYY